jgi:serine/threonine protein kinase
VPNGAGVAFEMLSSASAKISRSDLFDRHPYFHMLARVSFLLRARPYDSYATEARIVAREYLDTVYLRLSLAGAMPSVAITTRPMPFSQKRGKIETPRPRVGQYGIVDEEDRAAWKKVAHPFRDTGFILLRQIGVGDFGRVYEVLNQSNPNFPRRVALKVDRILGHKKQAILDADAAMRVGGQLAAVPHLVRLYDTGKLRGERFTYHVLQLIDGDTLDSLIQSTGVEHASTGPPSVRTSERQAREEYERAVREAASGDGQAWRRRRMGLPFRFPLSAAMVLDVLTSVLLMVEEVHQLGYAINDLKNDNLMMSRRGQIKGIDLDSFSPIYTPFDKMTDFMFLAACVILFVFNAPSSYPRRLEWKALAENEALLRAEFERAWPFGDVEGQSAHRVSRAELSELLVDLVRRCHQLVYTRQPELFSADIARLISIKRRLRAEEFVID